MANYSRDGVFFKSSGYIKICDVIVNVVWEAIEEQLYDNIFLAK